MANSNDWLPGDIIAIRGRGWLADHICKATKSEVSHVGLVIGTHPVIVLEALLRVKTNPLARTIENSTSTWRIRDLAITEDVRERIVNDALYFSAEDYGFADLLLQLLDALMRTRFFTGKVGRLFLRRFPICSFVVAEAYANAGTTFGVDPFGVDPWSATPGDIAAFCRARPDQYEMRQI